MPDGGQTESGGQEAGVKVSGAGEAGRQRPGIRTPLALHIRTVLRHSGCHVQGPPADVAHDAVHGLVML